MSSPSSEERVYKPKVPYPKPTKMSEQELEDAKCKALIDKLVVDFPSIDAEKIYPVVRSCVKRITSQNLSREQCRAMLSEELFAAIPDMIPEEPAQPSQRKLPKLASPGRFVVPCLINGIELKDSLCDTGANVNVISMAVAKKLGILELEHPKASLRLANSFSTNSKGFIPDLMLQVGDCLVPTDFHVMEMKEDNNDPLILGQAFLATVGAVVDFPNERISFSKINKDVFYPAVHVKGSSCMSVTNGGKPSLELGDHNKRIPGTSPLTSPSLQSDGVSTTRKVNRKRTSKPFSKFKIIIPEELREKGEEVILEMVQNTMKLLPGAVLWKSGAEKPPLASFSTDEGDPKPLKDPPQA